MAFSQVRAFGREGCDCICLLSVVTDMEEISHPLDMSSKEDNVVYPSESYLQRFCSSQPVISPLEYPQSPPSSPEEISPPRHSQR